MTRWLMMSLLLLAASGCAIVPRDVWGPLAFPEARTIEHRDPTQIPATPIPASVSPWTVAMPPPKADDWQLSLDDAIRIALENSRVIRVLAGTTAVSSGQTIYDAAITQTTIDQAQGRFDPTLAHSQQWSRTNPPSATTDLADFSRSTITNNATDAYLSNLGLTKTNAFGGQTGLTWIANPVRFAGGGSAVSPLFPGFGVPLNPQITNSLALSYTHPLLQGGGYRANMAPIVIARLNTEISFFQYKDSVQEMVRGVIEAYWNLVQARTDKWAREYQVKFSKAAYERELARLDAGLADKKDVSQAEVTYTQFEANLVAAKAIELTREGTLRNILGLPPSDERKNRYIVPVSAPREDHIKIDWQNLVRQAEQNRPDIIELKIIIEAEQQRLLQAENQMLPKLDAVALYRWNGLTGTMPNGETLASAPGKYNDWTVGINFSVPLGLRQGRAQVRQEKLLIERDRANLEQGLHAAIHELSATYRDLENAYAQYEAYKKTRKAAEANVEVQDEQFRAGRAIYLSVQQSLIDWGNAVSAEAAAQLSYNVALATLERRRGTILETHGLVFQEERFRAAGPLLHRAHDRDYPSALPPTGSPNLYPGTGRPAEDSFRLVEPAPRNLQSDVHFLRPIALDRVR